MSEVMSLSDVKPEVIRSAAGRIEVRLPADLRDRELTTGEAGALLGVTINTVKNWIRAGYVHEYLQTPSGRIHIPAREIERLLATEIRLNEGPDVGDLSESEMADLST